MSVKYYLYVTRYFPGPGNWRGAYSLDFVRALSSRLNVGGEDWKVLVFMPGSGPDYEVSGVHVFRFSEWKLPSSIFSQLFARRNRLSFVRKVKAIVGIDGRATCCVCHANTASCGIYALAGKDLDPTCLTVLHHHDLASFGLNTGCLHTCWLHNVIQYSILRRMHEAIDCHVFISEASRRSFLAVPKTDWTVYADYRKQYRGLGLYRSPRIKSSVILHNGVDAEVFRRGDGRVHEADEFVIGCVGNMQVLKDQECLIRAVALLDGMSSRLIKRLRVIFVGTGERLAACRRLAEGIKESVHSLQLVFEFRTEVPHEKLVDFYRELDLFVLPSYFEGFGCVYTEAWCCGVPFIACEGQGTDDLIAEEDRDKWLCKPRDPKDLAQKIHAYLVNRWEQKLTQPVDLKTLVSGFVRQLEDLRVQA